MCNGCQKLGYTRAFYREFNTVLFRRFLLSLSKYVHENVCREQRASEGLLLYTSLITTVFAVVTVTCLVLFFRYYLRASMPLTGTTEWISRIVNKPHFTLTFRRHPMTKRDALPLAIITIVCAALGFLNLGDLTNPQSFYHFDNQGDTVLIELDEPTDIGAVMYYTGLWIGSYKLEFSNDGNNWQRQYAADDHDSEMNQPHSDLFKWRYADVNDFNLPTKYIRITAERGPLELGELALTTKFGTPITADHITTDAVELFDEQDIVPDAPSYMNSMYFDEIYHGRTAYENLRDISPYETTHPPLGKLIISVGVSLFGMVPFGWRFMGVLFGVLMLPILYIFLKNMFGKTVIASCGTILFGFDFMHFVQTRIGTIDTYGVIFILLSYFFMYRFITLNPETPIRKSLWPLALSGLSFGIGCASKWTVIYAGAGLLALYILHLVQVRKYYDENDILGFRARLLKTLLLTGVFFLVIPAIIYCLSYIQNAHAAGMRVSEGMLWDPAFYKMIWNNQKFMFSYHSGLDATHAYGSSWYQWIVDGRPILYYRDTSMGGGLKSAFASFGNPLVWWGGFLAMIAMGYRFYKYKDGKALFILIGYFSQLAPWFFISRVVFIYHYFPSVIFLVLALSHVFNTIWERRYGSYRMAVLGFTGATVGLFAAFYPVLTGVPVSEFYTKYFLRWIPSAWPF